MRNDKNGGTSGRMEAQGKDVAQLQLKLLQDELSLLEKGSDEYNTKLVEIERKRTEIIKKANEEKLNLHKQYIKDSLSQYIGKVGR